MATTLRELIAKVVFRADPTQLEALNTKLDGAKSKLAGLEAQMKKGLPSEIGLAILKQQLEAAQQEVSQTEEAIRKLNQETGNTKPAADKASSGLSDLKNLLGGLSVAAAAYKAVAFGKQLIDEARAVGDLSASLGIATDELQTWSALAEQVGASTEDVAGSVKTLSKNMQDVAKEGKGPAADAFKALGISTDGWGKKLPSTMDLLLQTGGALAGVESDAKRLALAQQVLGESSLKLLPAFEGGTEAAKEQLDQLHDLAVVYDTEFIKNATAADNEMKLLERQLKGVGVAVLLDVLPVFRDFVHWVTPLVKDVRELAKSSNILQSASVALGVAGIAMLTTKLGGLSKVLKTGGKAMLEFVLPMLVLDDVISLLKGEGSVIGDALNSMFGAGTSDTTRKAILGIFDGFKELVQFLKGDTSADEFFEKFIKGTQPVQDAIDGMVAYIKTKIDELLGYTTDSISQAGTQLTGRVLGKVVGITQASQRTARVAGGADPETGMQPVAPGGAEAMPWYMKGLAKIMGISKEGIRADRIAGGIDPDTGGRLMRNANNALALGGSPAASGGQSTTVTVNDHSTVTTTLNGVDGQNVGAALRTSENNVAASLKRNKAQILAQTVGAANL